MRNVLITFGGAQYDETIKDIIERGLELGADDVLIYDDRWLTHQEFYRHNRWLWDHPHKRGFGWYAWKPFVLIDALSKFKDGDVVMFVDADCRPVADFSSLFKECRKIGGIMLFEDAAYQQRQWCKKDCSVVMAQDDDAWRDVQHIVARFMLFEKGPWISAQFLMEWLTYCVNPLANTFDKSVLGPEAEGFIEHRCEQAILTNLAHKYAISPRHDGAPLFQQDNPNNSDPATSNKTLEVRGSRYCNV